MSSSDLFILNSLLLEYFQHQVQDVTVILVFFLFRVDMISLLDRQLITGRDGYPGPVGVVRCFNGVSVSCFQT